jgi:sialidase-1
MGACIPAFALAVGLTAGAAADVEKADLFAANTDGYLMYRIPGLVVTANDVALAYCEARKSGGDWAAIDVMLRRSPDGGKTWEPRRQIAHFGPTVTKNAAALALKNVKPTDVTVNNPVMIADKAPGVVHFLYCVEYARCFYCRSTDDAKTFSEPVEVTAAFDGFRPEYPWTVIATGPGHGVQLKSGRLVVPVWLSTGTGGGAHRPSVTSTIVSDDGGKTWRRGEVALPDTPEFINPNETVVVELTDGRVMLNARTESKAHRRAVAVSPDGAAGWTKPMFQPDLLEPICMGSLVRAPGKPGGLLFANPDTLEKAGGKAAAPGQSRDRKNLTVQYSPDDGRTWPAKRVLEPGNSGYSDLAVAADGTVLCFYERGTTDGTPRTATKSLCVARFPLGWVTGGGK